MSIEKKPRGRRYGGVSAEHRRAVRHELFLDSALDLFGSKGFRAASVRAVCRAAGLTDRYFYESFADTEDLLIAVYEREMDRLHQSILEAAPNWPEGREARLQAALNLFFDTMSDPRTARIALVEVLGVSSKVDTAYQNNTQRFAMLVLQLLREELPTINADLQLLRALGSAMAGACTVSAAQWMLEDYRTPQAVMVQACQMIVMGVLNQLDQVS